jgi:hypothetical protein
MIYFIIGFLFGVILGFLPKRAKKSRVTRNTIWCANSDLMNVRNIKIKNLDDTHLVNIIAWVKERQRSYPEKLLPVLMAEVKRRNLSDKFLSLAPIPVELWGKSEKEVIEVLC